MSDDTEGQSKSKAWWKDLNILIGIGGVLATIIVGVITYWLTTDSVSREYQERIKAARNDVLAIVVRSLGEGTIPNKEKIICVISSIRRQYNIKAEDFESAETVIDDILARVLANEFLDGKRREELSSQLLTAKGEKINIDEHNKLDEHNIKRLDSSQTPAAILGILSSIIAGISLIFTNSSFRRLSMSNGSFPLLIRKLTILVIIFSTIILTMWLLSSRIIDTIKESNLNTTINSLIVR